MNQRHRARRLALQGLCCLDVRGAGCMALIDVFIQDSKESPPTLASATEMLRRTAGDLPQCDLLLARHARHWDLSRLAMVDRNILRLAVSELRAATAPHKVVIAEALRLAQEFSTAESPRFINGVLDAIAKEIAAAGGEPQATGSEEE